MKQNKSTENFDRLFETFFLNEEEPPQIDKTVEDDAVDDILVDQLLHELVPATVSDASSSANKTPSLRTEKLEMNEIDEERKNQLEGGSAGLVITPEAIVPRSDVIDDILSHVPNGLIRWGITAIFLIVVGLITMSYFIQYPDIVKGPIRIVSSTPPARIAVKSPGALQLFKQDKTVVESGEVIALLQNDADYKDVQQLEQYLQTLKTKLDRRSALSNFAPPLHLSLGTLQLPFSELVFHLKNRERQRKIQQNDSRRKQNIDRQIQQLQKKESVQARQVKRMYQEYSRMQLTYRKRYQTLYRDGHISIQQLETKQAEVVQQEQNLEYAKNVQNDYKQQIMDLEARKDELDFSHAESSTSQVDAITIAYTKLVNEMRSWNHRYLLTAPVAGRLNYLQSIQNNTNVQQEQEIASIVPLSSNIDSSADGWMGELLVDATGVGKIEVGQEVNVELYAYNKKEYGVIVGKVATVSDVGNKNNQMIHATTQYKVSIIFDEALEATTGKKIAFKHDMEGQAEVVTKNIRLLARIFHELRAVFDK